MVMSEVFDKLGVLQDIFVQKNELENKLDNLPKEVENSSKLLERLKTEYIAANESYEQLRAKINGLKKDLFETEQIKGNAENAMDNIKTQREFEALEKEIKEADKKCSELRRDLQKHENEYKAMDEALKNQEAFIEQNEISLNKAKQEYGGDIAAKKKQLEDLLVRKEEVIPGIDAETLFKFERIIKNKHGKGLVPVKNNICTGCHMILPAQFTNEVRSGKEIKYCPYCSRILYYIEADVQTEQEAFFDDSDMGGLADLDEVLNDSSIMDVSKAE